MKRLFLQLWAKLFCSLLAAAIVVVLVVLPRMKQEVGHNLVQVLTPLLHAVSGAVAQERARGGDLPDVLARVSDRFAVIVTAITRADVQGLDAAELATLDRGQVVVRIDALSPLGYEGLAGTDQVLTVALPGPPQPLGRGRGIIIGLLFVTGLSLGVAFIAWPLGRRLGRLSRAARSLGAGELSTRAEVGPRDAVGHLEATFNGMAEELQRLVTSHGELLRMVSHELRTPIQRLHVALEMAAKAPDDAAREPRLARMVTDLEELDALIEELLVYSRLEKRFALEKQPVHVADLLRDAVDALAELRGDESVEVSPDVSEVLTLFAEPRLARRAVENLVQNAMRHAAHRVVLRAEQAGGQVRIDVDDDGPGVPEAERAQIFAPFRQLPNSPQGARGGHGLGLAIAQRIADSHAGKIEVSSSPLGGARFQLWLPSAE
jgi:two-component system, OmpR family, sensor histidine kinase RstB